ncbi:hypothetical protein F2Q69_00052053 [Brassica cretica]|uniref:Uncharacterized protein n=1 Tax=Brassica cretica TaxID=69181 RepID=A0A8S9MYQ6_BRACR|nr:hypothetical protein F2Q69_00052053 [Brassica cretica]
MTGGRIRDSVNSSMAKKITIRLTKESRNRFLSIIIPALRVETLSDDRMFGTGLSNPTNLGTLAQCQDLATHRTNKLASVTDQGTGTKRTGIKESGDPVLIFLCTKMENPDALLQKAMGKVESQTSSWTSKERFQKS